MYGIRRRSRRRRRRKRRRRSEVEHDYCGKEEIRFDIGAICLLRGCQIHTVCRCAVDIFL
jgi:hypothetical protein